MKIRDQLYVLLIICFCQYVSTHQESEYRLPETVKPEHYDLDILVFLDEKYNFTFSGNVSIQIKALEETDHIVLHSEDLEIIEENIKLIELSNKNESFNVVNVTYQKEVDFLKIYFNNSLKKGSYYELKIPFNGFILNTLLGFYRSSYKNANGEKEWLAVTQFEENHARKAFPCFDEPAFKATFSISIGRMNGFTSITNMPLLTTEPIEGMSNWYWDRFGKSVPMSTYLVGFMVSQFEYIESTKDHSNVLFRVWARKDALNQTHYASEVGPKILSFYEKYFDVPYPLPKQDMIAVPDFKAGAMENWGIITYRETALLYEPNISSISNKYRVASVIAHELAHQWFGNLVTMKWWTDLWLNEGFATYVATLGVNHLNPEWNVHAQDASSNIISVFNLDSLNNSHPVSVPIKHPEEIAQIFDAISYEKGSAILRMMNSFLGEEVFRKGINSYLNKYKYKNAEQDDLWEALTESAHSFQSLPNNITVKQIMDTWTKQTGYPLIHIKRNYKENSADISQVRYRDMIKKLEDSSETWWVPLTFIFQDNTQNTTKVVEWLEDKSKTLNDFPQADKWVICNINMSGLYRINYDIENWNMLIDALHRTDHDKIPVLNRLQLIIDSMDLASIGQLDYNVTLRLIHYIHNENEYVPWKGALGGLSRIDLILKRSPHYGVFKKYMRKLISPIFNKIGGLNTKVISTPTKLDAVRHQVLISSWACRVDVPSCKRHALQLFYKWMEQEDPDLNNDIPSDLRSEVYCVGINKGGEAEWEFLWKRYLKSNVAAEKDIILQSLGCGTDIWILFRYLEWSISEKSGIRRQDSTSVFGKIGSTEIGYYIAKKFLFERTSDIINYHKSSLSTMGRYVKIIAHQISTKSEYLELSKWTEENKEHLKEANIAVKQALESANIRLQWIETYKNTIIDVLENIMKEE